VSAPSPFVWGKSVDRVMPRLCRAPAWDALCFSDRDGRNEPSHDEWGGGEVAYRIFSGVTTRLKSSRVTRGPLNELYAPGPCCTPKCSVPLPNGV
jgi:hypothetical protein